MPKIRVKMGYQITPLRTLSFGTAKFGIWSTWEVKGRWWWSCQDRYSSRIAPGSKTIWRLFKFTGQIYCVAKNRVAKCKFEVVLWMLLSLKRKSMSSGSVTVCSCAVLKGYNLGKCCAGEQRRNELELRDWASSGEFWVAGFCGVWLLLHTQIGLGQLKCMGLSLVCLIWTLSVETLVRCAKKAILKANSVLSSIYPAESCC